ncbi:hypothetical protein Adu01nite_36140 [Paractinoplanes durhamensis]|uniref:PhzF family phenazine biosynthesis protein n=1 Tax=Paractinoplanes durhamensis TaxID=113563 RepID=A0ABQ3YY90_9ACTN|nr:hypothetical protein Adu01nite_36140 [Actinoplanes durhamensis]
MLDDVVLSDAERRAIPGLADTSHAAFVTADGAVRFFTSEGELPACGHGTVAALAWLAQRTGRADHVLRVSGRAFEGSAVRLGDGSFEVAFDPGPVTLRTPVPAEISEVAAAAGVDAASGCVATLGRPRLLLAVPDRASLAALAPDMDRLRAATEAFGLLGCYVHTPPDDGGRCAARMFAPAIGVPEDIANANSTACLATHLARPIAVDMGDSLGRPATIAARPGFVGGFATVPGRGVSAAEGS